MIRRRGQGPAEDDSSSSDDEDAFAVLSTKKKKRMKPSKGNEDGNNNNDGPPTTIQAASKPQQQHQQQQLLEENKPKILFQLPKNIKSGDANNHKKQPLTSSMKRHHKPNDDRKAKMEALLQELEAEKNHHLPKGGDHPSHHHQQSSSSSSAYRFVPDKKGSFVDPSEEHLTTNIFVGNLAPSITEEDLTDLFLQFGELYSIKIMWPRTQAERSRKRNTGFVCFMNREDAEEAMEACNESDPFDVGRLLMMRWGKNVKKVVRQGTGGGMEMSPMLKSSSDPMNNLNEPQQQQHQQQHHPQSPKNQPQHSVNDDYLVEDSSLSFPSASLPRFIEWKTPAPAMDISKATPFVQSEHGADAIRVELPKTPKRFHFISTVAQFVAKDGFKLERRLIDTEIGNERFNFLTLQNSTQFQTKEHIFYRWRVFSFCQGDTFNNWRTEPFVMFHPFGRYWIPPPLNNDAACEERESEHDRKEVIANKEERRYFPEKTEYLTGRQIERARGGRRKGNRRGVKFHDGTKLTKEDLERFDELVRKKLSISRETICEAMAFCFEKRASAKEIANLLKEVLMDNPPHVTVNMRIARLYLMSDILFNSQQPGVRNAFMYRDALEKMAPEVFASLGAHGGGTVGRMTMNKLRKAVSTVLGAWTEWSVYNPEFLDELEACFEGKERKAPELVQQQATEDEPAQEFQEEKKPEEVFVEITTTKPQGNWTEVGSDQEEENPPQVADDIEYKETAASSNNVKPMTMNAGEDGAQHGFPSEVVVDSKMETEDVDGDPMEDEEVDGEPIEDEKVDGEPIEDEEVDGEPIEDEEVDGEPIEDEDVDGAPIEDEDVDGTPIDDEEVDGEPIEDEEVDGEPIEDEDVDGAPIEDADVDGAPIDGDEIVAAQIKEHDVEPIHEDDVDGEVIEGDDLDGKPVENEGIDRSPIDQL